MNGSSLYPWRWMAPFTVSRRWAHMNKSFMIQDSWLGVMRGHLLCPTLWHCISWLLKAEKWSSPTELFLQIWSVTSITMKMARCQETSLFILAVRRVFCILQAEPTSLSEEPGLALYSPASRFTMAEIKLARFYVIELQWQQKTVLRINNWTTYNEIQKLYWNWNETL